MYVKERFLLEGGAGGVVGVVVKDRTNPSLLKLRNMKNRRNQLVNERRVLNLHVYAFGLQYN